MQNITITLNSFDIDFQDYVNNLGYVLTGETVIIKTLDNIEKTITKN